MRLFIVPSYTQQFKLYVKINKWRKLGRGRGASKICQCRITSNKKQTKKFKQRQSRRAQSKCMYFDFRGAGKVTLRYM